MPNWCSNTLTVTGDRDALELFAAAVYGQTPDDLTGEPLVLDFERHLPTPPELLEDRGDPDEGRLPDWRTWRSEHWGTKWNASCAKLTRKPRQRSLVYQFDTAWSPPLPWLAYVVHGFAELVFELHFHEEFDHFSGTVRFENGKPVSPE